MAVSRRSIRVSRWIGFSEDDGYKSPEAQANIRRRSRNDFYQRVEDNTFHLTRQRVEPPSLATASQGRLRIDWRFAEWSRGAASDIDVRARQSERAGASESNALQTNHQSLLTDHVSLPSHRLRDADAVSVSAAALE